MSKKNPVILFNSHLLPPSQTFIRSLGEELKHFTPYYMGCKWVDGLELPPDRVCVINSGKKTQTRSGGNSKPSTHLHPI